MKFFAAALIASLTSGLNLRDMEEDASAMPFKQMAADSDFEVPALEDLPVFEGEGEMPEFDAEKPEPCSGDEAEDKPKKGKKPAKKATEEAEAELAQKKGKKPAAEVEAELAQQSADEEERPEPCSGDEAEDKPKKGKKPAKVDDEEVEAEDKPKKGKKPAEVDAEEAEAELAQKKGKKPAKVAAEEAEAELA